MIIVAHWSYSSLLLTLIINLHFLLYLQLPMKTIVEKNLNDVRARLRAMPSSYAAPKTSADRQKLLVGMTQQVLHVSFILLLSLHLQVHVVFFWFLWTTMVIASISKFLLMDLCLFITPNSTCAI